MSHKYQLDRFLSAAVIPRLKHAFPTELEPWDEWGGFDGAPPLEAEDYHAIEALNLFRLLDRPEMVPTALYGCCQLRPADLLRGVTRSDGVTREHLSSSDLELCFEVKEKLTQATVDLVAQLCDTYEARLEGLSSSNPRCSSPDRCSDDMKMVLFECREYLRKYIGTDPLETAIGGGLRHWTGSAGRICDVCGDSLKEKYSQFREEVWRRLPDLMGMEVVGWDSG